MTHLLVLALAGVLLAYIVLLLLVWRFQEQIVFQPPAAGASRTAATPIRRIRYRAADGVNLHAYVVGAYSAASTIVLAFHGNAELAEWFLPWASDVVRDTAVCVVLPEYRGYGGLAGTPSYLASSLDARAALECARQITGAPATNIVYFGHSLGSAIAAELAAHEPPRALVLQSPLSSARAMSRRLPVPGVSLFWRIISRVHFDTLDRVRALESPVWVAHGDRDIIVPSRMGRAVFDAAFRKGELLVIPGAGHNDVPEAGGADYRRWLGRALTNGSSAPIPAARAKRRSAL